MNQSRQRVGLFFDSPEVMAPSTRLSMRTRISSEVFQGIGTDLGVVASGMSPSSRLSMFSVSTPQVSPSVSCHVLVGISFARLESTFSREGVGELHVECDESRMRGN